MYCMKCGRTEKEGTGWVDLRGEMYWGNKRRHEECPVMVCKKEINNNLRSFGDSPTICSRDGVEAVQGKWLCKLHLSLFRRAEKKLADEQAAYARGAERVEVLRGKVDALSELGITARVHGASGQVLVNPDDLINLLANVPTPA